MILWRGLWQWVNHYTTTMLATVQWMAYIWHAKYFWNHLYFYLQVPERLWLDWDTVLILLPLRLMASIWLKYAVLWILNFYANHMIIIILKLVLTPTKNSEESLVIHYTSLTPPAFSWIPFQFYMLYTEADVQSHLPWTTCTNSWS
jgi:hypothetical protein